MALFKKIKTFLKKRLEETGESSADTDQLMQDVLHIVENARYVEFEILHVLSIKYKSFNHDFIAVFFF